MTELHDFPDGNLRPYLKTQLLPYSLSLSPALNGKKQDEIMKSRKQPRLLWYLVVWYCQAKKCAGYHPLCILR